MLFTYISVTGDPKYLESNTKIKIVPKNNLSLHIKSKNFFFKYFQKFVMDSR